MQRKEISLLVILYGKDFTQSQTLKCILDFENKIDNLVVVNNGPEKLNDEDSFLNLLKLKHNQVCLFEFLENKPLSWIYNDFVANFKSDYYVIFDDDTYISKESEKQIFNLSDIDIEIPKIYAIQDKKQYYPIVNGNIYTSYGLIAEYSEIYSIGSGLIFSKNVKDVFRDNNLELFDSNFSLYGVDISFFRKVNYLKGENIAFKVSSLISIDHSLSRAEGEISEWRYIERLYDQTLSIKYYQKFKMFRLLKLLIKNFRKLNRIQVILMTYFNGFHPRCAKKAKK